MARITQEKEKNFTVFGSETEFEGTLEFTDSLVIAGTFSGSINATGSLEIAKSAVCKVDTLKVQSVIIEGELSGNIEASERVEMCSGSVMTGNVLTARLRIADDVSFDGDVTMIRAAQNIDVFAMSADELKKSVQEQPVAENSAE